MLHSNKRKEVYDAKNPHTLYRNRIQCSINILANEIRAIAEKISHNPQVTPRVKNIEALRKKMRFYKTHNVSRINDVYGIRVLVASVSEVYAILERITKAFHGYLEHDYIANPKTRPNDPALEGKVLRLLQFIAYRNGVPFEIQITTYEFHAMNELLHEAYHKRKYDGLE